MTIYKHKKRLTLQGVMSMIEVIWSLNSDRIDMGEMTGPDEITIFVPEVLRYSKYLSEKSGKPSLFFIIPELVVTFIHELSHIYSGERGSIGHNSFLTWYRTLTKNLFGYEVIPGHTSGSSSRPARLEFDIDEKEGVDILDKNVKGIPEEPINETKKRMPT